MKPPSIFPFERRASHPVCWIALVCSCLAAWAQAQVTGRNSSPALDQGIVAEWKNGTLIRGDASAALGDFSLVIQPGGDGSFVASTADWKIRGTNDAIVFATGTASARRVVLQTSSPKPTPRSIVVSIKRDARQALSGLWIDGIEKVSATVAPGLLALIPSAVTASAASLSIYDRALTRPEIIALASQPPSTRPAPFDGQFTVTDGEVIAVLGGTEAVGLIESAWLETALAAFAAGKKFSVRDLAWETDTALRQDRPMNFGGLSQQLQRVGATTVVLMFGRQECLEMEAAGAGKFHDALEKIIQTCAAQTQRLVIVGPVPFEKKPPPLPDLSTKNAALHDYNDALLALAERNHGLFVDVIAAWPEEAARWTTDGLTMTGSGHRVLARIIARQLWNGLPLDASAQPMRDAIIQKNKLWHDYWRPSNWAFLHGDRTAQPSSRDHLNPNVRWFPAELEKYLELIAAKERDIRRQAAERGGKLP